MSEYPEDIVEAAKAARRAEPLSDYAALAFAIQAERERCARIAETYPEQVLQFWDRPGGPPGNGYRPSTFADVAAAIRHARAALEAKP